jgi:cytoskeleton protein RodZ
MATRDQEAGLPIGEALKRARTRQKIDIRTAEAETKIRIKYLRALETEEWEVLPGPAYAKGFLRTYAQFLGLDGDALVDEYRRRVESTMAPSEETRPIGEPLLERRRRPGEQAGRRWLPRAPVLAWLGAGVVAILVLLSVLGGSDDDGRRGQHQKGKQSAQRRQGDRNKQPPPAPPETITLSFVARDDVEVCLVTGAHRALIDAQALVSGSRAGPYSGSHFRLDLESGGAVELALGGKRRTVRSPSPATFQIDSGGVEQVAFKGPDCP